MHLHRTARALQRAQWFFDLSYALGEAERLLAMIEADGGFPDEAVRLRLRIRVVRSELALLNKVALSEARVVGAWPDPVPVPATRPRPELRPAFDPIKASPEAPRPRRTAP